MRSQGSFIPGRRAAVALALALAGGLTACGLTEVGTMEVGTVVFVDVEGGCWGIDTVDGRMEPRNLPESMRVDSLRVQFMATRVLDVATVCQIGPVIDLVSIRRAP